MAPKSTLEHCKYTLSTVENTVRINEACSYGVVSISAPLRSYEELALHVGHVESRCVALRA